MKRTCQLSLIFLALLFSQCRKETNLLPEDTNENSHFTIQKGDKKIASFSGQILNETGIPVAYALVKIGDKTASCDVNGFFSIEDAAVYTNHAYARVYASGYFFGSRTVLPKEGINQIHIKLLSNAHVGSFSASQGGEIQVGRAKVSFGAGYVHANGSPYNGTVSVAFKYLDPEADNLNEIMPGDLLASSEEGDKMLESFGMIAVELKDNAGNKLQLAENNEAVVRMGLSASALAKAPNSLPLWYFDEEKGHWIEEGKAELIDGEYVGSVKHFSFWNCDVPRDYNRIDGIVKTTDGNPLAGVKISLVSSLMGTGKCYTSSEGQYGGRVPSGESFTLHVSYMTQDGLKTMILGPYNSDEIIPDIILGDIPGTIKIQGSAIDCKGLPVAKGVLFINDLFPVKIADGKYSFYYLASTPYTTRYYDQGTGTYSSKKTVPGYSSNHIMPAESVCGNGGGGGGGGGSFTYEISYRIDGVPTRYTLENRCTFGYSSTMQYIEVFRTNASNDEVFKLKILNYSGTGIYTVNNQLGDSLWLGNRKNEHCTVADNIEVNVVDYFIVSGSPSNISMDIRFSGTVNVWNENKQLFEKKPLTDGKLTATR